VGIDKVVLPSGCLRVLVAHIVNQLSHQSRIDLGIGRNHIADAVNIARQRFRHRSASL
jgi:hypothetical protein